MFGDLLAATRDYWRKLDEIEAAYQRNELTIEEVDAKVYALIADLGQTRRKALSDSWTAVKVFTQQQRDTLAGAAALGILAYLWVVFNSSA